MYLDHSIMMHTAVQRMQHKSSAVLFWAKRVFLVRQGFVSDATQTSKSSSPSKTVTIPKIVHQKMRTPITSQLLATQRRGFKPSRTRTCQKILYRSKRNFANKETNRIFIQMPVWQVNGEWSFCFSFIHISEHTDAISFLVARNWFEVLLRPSLATTAVLVEVNFKIWNGKLTIDFYSTFRNMYILELLNSAA